MANSMLAAFLDGFTGGSLFVPAIMPGAATQLFADESTEQPQAELTEALLRLELEENSRPPDSQDWVVEIAKSVNPGIDSDTSQLSPESEFTKHELSALHKEFELQDVLSAYRRYVETMKRFNKVQDIERSLNLRKAIDERLREKHPIGS